MPAGLTAPPRVGQGARSNADSPTTRYRSVRVASPMVSRAWVGVVLLALVLPAPGAWAEASHAVLPAFQPTFNGNFSAVGVGPETSVLPGTTLLIEFEMEEVGYSTALPGLYVRVPAPVALFNVSYGVLRIALPAVTVNFNSSGWTSTANTTTKFYLANETVFPNASSASDRATLSSQTVALTSPAPYGSFSFHLRWRWATTSLAGINSTGMWSPNPNGTVIQPDQYAQLQSPLTLNVPPGAGATVCLNGPVAGRTFSLHAVEPFPHLDFANTTATAPASGPLPYCVTLTLPSWLEPGLIDVDVWDYHAATSSNPNVTSFLLYVVKVNVAPASSPPPSLYGISFFDWYAGVGILAAAILGLVALLVYRRLGPPSPSAAEPSTVPAGAIAPAPPPEKPPPSPP
jgi:hypothetical protein